MKIPRRGLQSGKWSRKKTGSRFNGMKYDFSCSRAHFEHCNSLWINSIYLFYFIKLIGFPYRFKFVDTFVDSFFLSAGPNRPFSISISAKVESIGLHIAQNVQIKRFPYQLVACCWAFFNLIVLLFRKWQTSRSNTNASFAQFCSDLNKYSRIRLEINGKWFDYENKQNQVYLYVKHYTLHTTRHLRLFSFRNFIIYFAEYDILQTTTATTHQSLPNVHTAHALVFQLFLVSA